MDKIENQLIKAYENINKDDRKSINLFLRKKEKVQNKLVSKNDDDVLYPLYDDVNFNIKIAKKKEFNNLRYNVCIKRI